METAQAAKAVQTVDLDRASAVRTALRSLVAEHGFHGASMSAVARRAGVATGTAYVHYPSKDELVYATYLEIKEELGAAILAELPVGPSLDPVEMWSVVMRAAHRHLAAEPERARFLTQLEESPYHAEAHRRLEETGNPLLDLAAEPAVASSLAPLPLDVLYALSFGVLVKLVAADVSLSEVELDSFVNATWRSITTD